LEVEIRQTNAGYQLIDWIHDILSRFDNEFPATLKVDGFGAVNFELLRRGRSLLLRNPIRLRWSMGGPERSDRASWNLSSLKEPFPA
jgi:hypothetical protein